MLRDFILFKIQFDHDNAGRDVDKFADIRLPQYLMAETYYSAYKKWDDFLFEIYDKYGFSELPDVRFELINIFKVEIYSLHHLEKEFKFILSELNIEKDVLFESEELLSHFCEYSISFINNYVSLNNLYFFLDYYKKNRMKVDIYEIVTNIRQCNCCPTKYKIYFISNETGARNKACDISKEIKSEDERNNVIIVKREYDYSSDELVCTEKEIYKDMISSIEEGYNSFGNSTYYNYSISLGNEGEY